MSDTMTVKTLCDHGRADPHHINLGTAVCPGGKEITLRQITIREDVLVGNAKPESIIRVFVEVDDDE